MDIVYPFKAAGKADELRYSLRSLKNLRHGKVWIIGDHPPPWLKNVDILPVLQNTANKWTNARHNIISACEHPDVSDDFILFNDDFFVMKPVDRIRPWCRGTVQESIGRYKEQHIRSGYATGLLETNELLRWAGVTGETYAYNLHVPMVINKHKMLECVDYLRSLKPKTVPQCFHLRTWYGNFWQIGGELMMDVKVRGRNSKIPTGPFISTSNAMFNPRTEVCQHIMSSFEDASPYEGASNGPNIHPRPNNSSRAHLKR